MLVGARLIQGLVSGPIDRHPVIDLHLFSRRNFRVATCVIGLSYFALSGVNIIFPLWLQTTAGYTATWAFCL